MSRPAALLLASCLALVAPFVSAKSLIPIDELRQNFTVGGEPVPAGIFRDMGDGDLADSSSIVVTIDVKAATGSNRYADPIKRNGAWVAQTRQSPGDKALTEEEAYRFIGMTASKLLVAVTSYSGGGSGVFYSLQILAAEAGRGFDSEGKRYERLNVTTLRSVALGDRWNGDVRIEGNTVVVTTTGGIPGGQGRKPSTMTIRAERP
ncbi:hypothetical protein [Bradyrhizobium liaoningense]|uniref:hypothetical protein n=1 Tax=Bradyrhizobium liaoningense TaxID=43992 RepID=UPI001BAB9CC6|nr:hypothetical protein [Bradyrhizobium liaoningense]MBR0718326.1 hypothetical protein [Bradyrhizobium liaoningense]